jgi:hypothetical protein
MAGEQAILHFRGGHAHPECVVEDAPVLSDMALLFDALRSDALPKVASRDLIVRAVKERWTT